MNRHKNMHLYACQPRRIATLLLITGAFFCTLSGFIATSSIALAQGVPGGNVTSSIVSAVDVAKPAVVRIITNVSGRLTVNFSAGNNVTFPLDGTSYPLDISGSGAFISAHGDIVTADHVVHPPQADMTDFLYQIASQDIANYLNSTFRMNPPYDATQIYNALATGTFRSEPQFSTPRSRVYLSAAYTGPQNAKTFNNVPTSNYAPIDAIKRDSPTDQQDLAIIHVAMNDTPSIALGDSTAVSQQDNLTIIGFPGNADITQRQDPTQLLTASVNQVYVSAIKQDDNGIPLIQVSGNVEHGDSGGPALDSHGNIVGIVSFQKNSNSQPNNTSFLHVSENVQQMIDALKLNTMPGNFQQAWQQGFHDYAATSPGHWHKAVEDFTRLASHYPTFNALKPFLAYAQTEAKNEPLPQPAAPKSTPFTFLPYLLIGIGIVLLLVIGVAILRLSRKKSLYAHLPNLPTNVPMAHGSIPNPASPYSNLSLPASAAQQIAPLTPWEQQIADSSAWKSAPPPVSREQPFANPTPWNNPTMPPNTPNYIGTRETGYSSRQPDPFATDLPAAWSSEDAIIVDPLPFRASTASQGLPAQQGNQEITNKREAIQREQNCRNASMQESQRPAPLPNTPVDPRNNAQASFDWPLPATWQQTHPPTQEGRKEASQKPPQRDFDGANFDFNRDRQP